MLQLLPVALEPALQQFLALLFSFHEVAERRRGFFFFSKLRKNYAVLVPKLNLLWHYEKILVL